MINSDIAHEIINKYQLEKLAPHGVKLKIDNKYVLFSTDNVTNTIRDGDKIKFGID